MPGRKLDDTADQVRPRGTQVSGDAQAPAALTDRIAALESFARRCPAGPDEPDPPVMPAPPPFPTFHSKPTLPHQQPGNGFESGRDSRAR